MEFSKEDIYVSSSVNSVGKCISWRKFMVCGMSKSIVLINQTENSSRIIKQFTEHNDVVTCVSWISDTIIVSGDNSGGLIIWNIDENGNLINHKSYKVKTFLSGITDVNGVIIDDNIYIISCCEDRWSLLKANNILEITETQLLTFGINYVHSVNTVLFRNSILISCGLSDGRVMCYYYDVKENILSLAASLTGHEDAVMSIDTTTNQGKVLIATASLDCYVRIWEATVWSSDCAKTEMDTQKIVCNEFEIDIRLVAVLAGHENWVTSAHFSRNLSSLMLVSTSMDKSVIVWTVSETGGEYSEWSEETRLGQIGGNGLGFIGGSVSPGGAMIVGVGYQGSMIVWAWEEACARWASVANVGGHFDVVEDLAWESERGRYLITVAKDQTTRIHAPWAARDRTEWHEVGRPQVHGFDMTCVASLDAVTFVSGAEEKIGRVFAMNRAFSDSFEAVTGDGFADYPLSANVVATDALGLSNTVVSEARDDKRCCVPREEAIAGRTLWPEVTKLYAHVYEVFRVAAHGASRTVATCCKAAIGAHADVVLWSQAGGPWAVAQRLAFHKLTVVGLRFSHGGERLVTVSKDRQWALWGRDGDLFALRAHSRPPRCHAKIVWDCAWTADDSAFVTVARDRRAMLWDGHDGAPIGESLTMAASINAVSAMPLAAPLSRLRHVLALGLETGDICVVLFDRASLQWTVALTFAAHHDWITRLSFHPLPDEDDGSCLLASCAKDRFVKVYRLSMK